MKKYGLSLVIVVGIIFSIGLLMIFNTTSAEVLDRFLDRSTHQALLKQILYAFLGIGGAFLIWFLGYENILKLSGALLFFTTLLLVFVLIPGIGQQINGARRWLGAFGISFQPSEFAKVLIPLYFIQVICTRTGPFKFKNFFILLLTIAVPLGLILIEPDNGTVAIILVSLVVLFILTRIKWVFWALPLSLTVLIGTVVASQMKHVPDRIRIYLHPELDLKGKGHQPHQAKIAAGSGQFLGRGIGESLQKLNYLPEARSDYIAAIFAEECGFLGMSILIFLYSFIGYLGFSIAQRTVDLKGFYLVSIMTFLICFQAFLNLGVVSGLLPSKGTNLPFFSHGGSSLLANFMAICMILNVAYSEKREYEPI